MKTVYLVTLSNGVTPQAFRSFRAAREFAIQVSPARVGTKCPHGDTVMYATRADLYADRNGERSHIIQAIIRTISRPDVFLRDENWPRHLRDEDWSRLMCEAVKAVL